MSNSQNLLDFANHKATIVINMFLCFMKKFIMQIAWQMADQGICKFPDLSWPFVIICNSPIARMYLYKLAPMKEVCSTRCEQTHGRHDDNVSSGLSLPLTIRR